MHAAWSWRTTANDGFVITGFGNTKLVIGEVGQFPELGIDRAGGGPDISLETTTVDSLGCAPSTLPTHYPPRVARARLYPAWFPEVVTSPNCAHPRFLGVSL